MIGSPPSHSYASTQIANINWGIIIRIQWYIVQLLFERLEFWFNQSWILKTIFLGEKAKEDHQVSSWTLSSWRQALSHFFSLSLSFSPSLIHTNYQRTNSKIIYLILAIAQSLSLIISLILSLILFLTLIFLIFCITLSESLSLSHSHTVPHLVSHSLFCSNTIFFTFLLSHPL